MDTCESGGQPLVGGESTLPWEDGDNKYAYVRCKYNGDEAEKAAIDIAWKELSSKKWKPY